MKPIRCCTLLALACLFVASSPAALAAERALPRPVLLEKISGFWIGQLVGNYLGFPFENVYLDEPIPRSWSGPL
jgi:hypothetical protein